MTICIYNYISILYNYRYMHTTIYIAICKYHYIYIEHYIYI